MVLLLEPLSVGAVFPASRWPLHITLSTNFDIDEVPDAVSDAVARVASVTPVFTIVGAEAAMFGSRNATPVTLIEPREPIERLHAALVAGLAAKGAVFLYPEHMGDGYRPHATEQSHGRRRPMRLRTGQSVKVGSIALIDWPARGGPSSRRVVSVHPLMVDF